MQHVDIQNRVYDFFRRFASGQTVFPFAVPFLPNSWYTDKNSFSRFCSKREKLSFCFGSIRCMKKKPFYTELAYLLGILAIALGTAFMERADFGMSMVVAPAYVLYLKLSATWEFVTFGMMEYTLQAVVLLFMAALLRRFRLSYLFSFFTAVLYGFALDGCMALVGLFPVAGIPWRIVFFLAGALLCSLGVAFMFHTYLAPEAYELFVKEVSSAFRISISKFKTGYDCVSCLLGIVLSFVFFGMWHFEGVKWGTILCALCNGALIGWLGKRMEAHWEFTDALPFRRYFEDQPHAAEE